MLKLRLRIDDSAKFEAWRPKPIFKDLFECTQITVLLYCFSKRRMMHSNSVTFVSARYIHVRCIKCLLHALRRSALTALKVKDVQTTTKTPRTVLMAPIVWGGKRNAHRALQDINATTKKYRL